MSLIKINRHPSPRDLRVFATLAFVFLSALAYFTQFRGQDTTAALLFILASLSIILGVIAPRALRLPYLTAVHLTFPLGFVLSHLILALVYFGVMTPIGLLMRPLGRDPLQRRFDPARPTYWIPKTTPRPPTSYLKQH